MQFNGGFTFASGTSFSAPAVAGAAALYMSAKGGRANAPQSKVLNAYQAKASILPVSKGDQSLQTVSRQGAGTLKAYDAVYAGLQVSPTELLLNDTAYFNGVQTVTVTNTGSAQTQFKFSHTPVDTVFSKQKVSA
jgi:subtilisin family serine protease